MEINRRDIGVLVANSLLIAMLSHDRAWAKATSKQLHEWLLAAIGLKEDLIAKRINVLQWQAGIEKLNLSVPVNDIIKYLDIENITKKFTYETNLADMTDPILPKDLLGQAGMKQWFVRVFGMRKGGSIIPHVHNNMVSSHLVINGSFHARTHNRIKDLDDAIVLRPTFDGTLKKGQIISMSDLRHNQHWLIARENHSMTLDIGVVKIPKSWQYGQEANQYNMIYVDPTEKPQTDGTIIAPILSWEKAAKKFADFEE